MLVLDRWAPGPLLDLLVLEPDERRRATAELATVAAGTGVPAARLLDAFLARLPSHWAATNSPPAVT
jgi:hypothetical protein